MAAWHHFHLLSHLHYRWNAWVNARFVLTSCLTVTPTIILLKMICYQCIHNTEVYTAFQCFVIPLLYYTALYYTNTITKSTKKQSNVALQEMNKLFQVWDTQTNPWCDFLGRSDTKKNLATLNAKCFYYQACFNDVRPIVFILCVHMHTQKHTHTGAAKID